MSNSPCDCKVCQDAKRFSVIAEKCPENRAFLNEIWSRLEAAETEIEWRQKCERERTASVV